MAAVAANTEAVTEALTETAERTFTVKGPMLCFEFDLFGFHVGVTESIVTQWFILIILGVLFFILGRKLEIVPKGKRQVIAEFIVTFFLNNVENTMGVKYRKFTCYIGGLFCLSLLSSLSGLFGLRSPTSDLSVILAWGLITFVLVLRNKIRTGGIKGYLKSFIEPLPFMLPFNIIGDFANPVSQTVRHFANILAGSVIGGLIYFALGGIANGLASIGIPAVLSLYFDIFSAVIQAYIFTTLTMAYVSSAECGD